MTVSRVNGRPLLSWIGAGLLFLAPPGAGNAATVTVKVLDDTGKALPDAVVTLVPIDGKALKPAPALAAAVIDQRDETFVPYVVVIGRGGAVTFRNSDETRHHVYSFSAIKQFEFVEAPGDARSVTFDAAGSAAIGCNIHDQMEAYVFVTAAPFAAVTDSDGRAVFGTLPPGRFETEVWHPHLRPNMAPPKRSIDLASQDTNIAVTLAILPRRRRDPSDVY